jgi:hypothetical protein
MHVYILQFREIAMIYSIIIPICVLIIFPVVAMSSEIYFLEMETTYPFYLRYFEAGIIIVLLMYALGPVTLSSKKYFRQRPENLVVEYEFLKKIMYGGIPLLIIVMLIFLSTFQPETNFIYALFPGLILIVGGTLLRFISNVVKKEYRYYYARGCFQILLKEQDSSERMSYFIRGINSYNKYLRRTIKLQIRNINAIYSKIIYDSLLNDRDFILSILAEFQGDDKIKPTKYIANFLNFKNTDDYLTKEPLWDKIKEWGAFLAAIIPVAVSVVQFLFSTS